MLLIRTWGSDAQPDKLPPQASDMRTVSASGNDSNGGGAAEMKCQGGRGGGRVGASTSLSTILARARAGLARAAARMLCCASFILSFSIAWADLALTSALESCASHRRPSPPSVDRRSHSVQVAGGGGGGSNCQQPFLGGHTCIARTESHVHAQSKSVDSRGHVHAGRRRGGRGAAHQRRGGEDELLALRRQAAPRGQLARQALAHVADGVHAAAVLSQLTVPFHVSVTAGSQRRACTPGNRQRDPTLAPLHAQAVADAAA